jgi:transcriptional regulator GlxA family with amidase domain
MADFTVLILAGANASSVALTLDLLQTAATLAPRLKRPLPRWRVLSPGGGPVHLSGGMQLATAALPRRPAADGSTWVVPGLGLDHAEALRSRLADDDTQLLVRALRAHAGRGGRIAASCSAVFLLQAAGVLAGRRVTTAWWLAPLLRQWEPSCTVDADRMVCADGPISTGGAAFAQSDLMLHLLRSQFGTALADAVGRVLLLDGRQAQAPFVLPALLCGGDALVARLLARMEGALPAVPSVAGLAAELAMSPRTLSRHVRAATGGSTMALLQQVRLQRARRLIETSRMNIEGVAAAVGYADATALRRLMRKAGGATPSRFRAAKWGTTGAG